MNEDLWIKLFEANGKRYCYDIYTNNLMEVDPVLYQVLDQYDTTRPAGGVIGKLIDRFPEEKINEALSNIQDFQEKYGIFKTKQNFSLHFPFSKSEYSALTRNLIRHLILNITENCNFRCSYCKFTRGSDYVRQHANRSMSWPLIKKSIDFLVQSSSHYIEQTNIDITLGFYGGEPLLEAEKIFRSVEYVKKEYSDIFSRFLFSVTTNGSQLTDSNIKKLIEYDFNLLISLDGPKEINDRYRHCITGESSYEMVFDGASRIRELDKEYYKRRVGFSIVCAPEYRLTETVDYFRSKFLGENRIYFFAAVNQDDTDFLDNFDMEVERKKRDAQEELLKNDYIQKMISGENDHTLNGLFYRTVESIHSRHVCPISDKVFPNGICLPGLQKVLVDTDGNFHLCEKINWNFNIGNIEDGFDIDKIFQLIEGYIENTGDCQNCWAVRFCTDCYLSIIDGNGYSEELKRKKCSATQKRVLKDMKTYVEIIDKNPTAFKMTREGEQDDIMWQALKFLGRI